MPTHNGTDYLPGSAMDFRVRLAEVLNNMRLRQHTYEWAAAEEWNKGYLQALDDIAEDMGLKTRTEYTA